MNYVCTNCGDFTDEIGNAGAVVDPLAKTVAVTCIECRLAACAERSRVRAVRSDSGLRRTPKHNGKLATDRLPYPND